MAGIDWNALNSAVMTGFSDEKAVPVTYVAPGTGVIFEGLRGILDRYQIEVIAEDGAPTSVKRSMLSMCQADLPIDLELKQGGRIEVQGLTFHITDVQPDVFGWIYLPLGLVG
ncbi:head-tail joining protein [Pararoseomonas indoligenes]|uniref:Uncharacterized protein n=1 Tax=Roseomonas indoligenes TaxID=2820811 RepID=A0A940N0Q0_9PROT|nr:hypothetical protein [Pararoseomonas indoligenes]MBP0492172.1 hypothetical protein [Pararoseomonas indoligenes]